MCCQSTEGEVHWVIIGSWERVPGVLVFTKLACWLAWNLPCSNMGDSRFWTVTIRISTSLAGVSTITCLVAIGALLFFKAYRNFIYRLMLYILATLTITSLCTMIKYLMSIIKVDLRDNNITIQDNGTGFSTAHFIASYAVQSGVLTALLLITCVSLCIYLMALHHRQFTS